jgi:polar amino acid transport system substrate-binding protein
MRFLGLRQILSLFFVAWIASSGIAAADDLVGAFSGERPPYVMTDGDSLRGMEVEIVRAALNQTKHGIVAKAVPTIRLSDILDTTGYDFTTGLQSSDKSRFYESDVYLRYSDFVISKKARNIRLTTPADLFQYRVGTWQNGFSDLGLTAMKPAWIKGVTIEFPSDERAARFFFADRIDVLLMDKLIFQWIGRALSGEMNTSEPITFAKIFPSEIGVRAVFRSKAMRDDFNRGLHEIVANGEYQRIYSWYERSVPEMPSQP